MILLGVIILLAIIIAAVAAAVKAPGGSQPKQNDMSLKKAYLYLVSVISLVIAVVGAIMLINLALKTWVFTKADQNYYTAACPEGKTSDCNNAALQEQMQNNRSAQRQSTAAQALAMIIIATPVWWYHWTQARKEA